MQTCASVRTTTHWQSTIRVDFTLIARNNFIFQRKTVSSAVRLCACVWVRAWHLACLPACIARLPAFFIIIIVSIGIIVAWQLAQPDLRNYTTTTAARTHTQSHSQQHSQYFISPFWNIVLFCVLPLCIWFWHRVISTLFHCLWHRCTVVLGAVFSKYLIASFCIILLYLIFYLSLFGCGCGCVCWCGGGEQYRRAQLNENECRQGRMGSSEMEPTIFHSYFIVWQENQVKWTLAMFRRPATYKIGVRMSVYLCHEKCCSVRGVVAYHQRNMTFNKVDGFISFSYLIGWRSIYNVQITISQMVSPHFSALMPLNNNA